MQMHFKLLNLFFFNGNDKFGEHWEDQEYMVADLWM